MYLGLGWVVEELGVGVGLGAGGGMMGTKRGMSVIRVHELLNFVFYKQWSAPSQAKALTSPQDLADNSSSRQLA